MWLCALVAVDSSYASSSSSQCGRGGHGEGLRERPRDGHFELTEIGMRTKNFGEDMQGQKSHRMMGIGHGKGLVV